MAVEVILPRVDMDMKAGIIVRWLVEEGAPVKRGAALFIIETDKAAMEIDAPADGILGSVSGLAGVKIPVGTPVAWIYAQGETVPNALPVASLEVRAEARIRATPAARRIARERKISLAGIAGWGPNGRIQAADVSERAAPMCLMRPPALSDAPPVEGAAPEMSEISVQKEVSAQKPVPLTRMRQAMAERLTYSKQTIPHFYVNATCDMGALREMRARLNGSSPLDETGQPRWKISINDFLIKALAMALVRVPQANAIWADGEGTLPQHTSDIAMAVAVEGGLFTPVVRNAEAKSLSAIALETKDLATRARAGKLDPREYQGGSTSLSNLGMYGIDGFSAIINPPHATILAVGAVRDEPANWLGQLALRPRMAAQLSCDHRIVDGAIGAQLLQAFRVLIENPLEMLA